MNIRIKTFASVKDICGFSEKEISIKEAAMVKEVLAALNKNSPGLQEIMDSLLFAINEEYCTKEARLKADDILAIFPPVSGG